MICPQCRSARCSRSHRSGVIDFFGTLMGMRPWRCRICDYRFFAWQVPVSFARYAHCPKCGNFDLQRIAHDRVDRGTLLFVKRFLGFPAYRCEPCRERFYSVRRPRRIVPSVFPPEQSQSPST